MFQYLSGTLDHGIVYRSNLGNKITVYADAAYLCHEDTKSRTGVVIMMCGGVIATYSSKQKLVTLSSAEAELVAACEGVTIAIGIREFLIHQGLTLEPSKLYEDNQAVIHFIKTGKSKSRKSKHIKSRYFFIKQYVDDGEFIVEWCETINMIADIMTKPLVGEKFNGFAANMVVKTC